VDAETGEDVENEDIIKGYQVDTDTYITIDKEELENIALEFTRTIDIDRFVPKSEIDELYIAKPYYIVPDGKVGHDAFAVIRETIRATNKVALGRLVLTNREHVVALEPRDNGLMGLLLRYPYEVRKPAEYFDGIQDVKITKDMLALAKHIVEQKSGHFDPSRFEDRYEAALIEIIEKKQKGLPIAKQKRPAGGNVVDLMQALRESIKGGGKAAASADAKPARGKKAAAKTRRAS
jgi:DNA end-binding protein Ku